MQGPLFVPNINACTNATRVALNDVNATILNYQRDPSFTPDDIFNFTKVISGSVAECVFQCTISTVSAANYTTEKWALFDSYSELGQAFLQNLMGNIISFNNIFAKITAAQTAHDQGQVAYQYGRGAYLMVNFSPIEDSSLPSVKALPEGN